METKQGQKGLGQGGEKDEGAELKDVWFYTKY